MNVLLGPAAADTDHAVFSSAGIVTSADLITVFSARISALPTFPYPGYDLSCSPLLTLSPYFHEPNYFAVS